MHNMKLFQNLPALQGTGKIFPLTPCGKGGISECSSKTLTDFSPQPKEGRESLCVSKKIEMLADNINVCVSVFQSAVVTQCSCNMNHILKSYIRLGAMSKNCGFVFTQGKF